jgi:two-component system, cell cycle sensor histidine kinase and response regulator CckA
MKKKLRILLLEDSHLDAGIIEEHLRFGGIAFSSKRVETEASFRMALREFLPDVIFLDNQLPAYSGTSGLKLARELCPKVPVIFISGTIGEEKAIELIKLGATDYLLKEHLSRLVPAVQRAMREVKERRENATALEAQMAKRERADEVLRESRARFESVIQSAIDGIISVDEAHRIVLFNPAAERMFGCTEVEAIGQPLERFIPARLRAFAQSKGTGGAVGQLKNLTGQRAQNEEFPIEASISQTMTGGAKLLTLFLRDVTEQKRLEAQLRQAQKMEALGQLASGVAHDFNNLLMVIFGNGELLEMTLPRDAPQRESVDQISRAAERAAALTRQLLAFSRKQVPEFSIVDLNALVTDAEKMLRRLIGENVRLRTVLQPNLSRVQIDRGQMDQVIMNLAINARDAMAKGGSLTIETGEAELNLNYAKNQPEPLPDHYVVLSVSDTGCGMSPEVQARIFEPFFTTKPMGQGTGLGLSVVHGIVKQNQGYIALESASGTGTTFKIYLPPSGMPLTSAVESDTFRPVGGSETILLVEDEDPVRAVTGLMLETLGYRVLQAESGEEALSVANENRKEIDLLMTDVVMPDMSGRELADKLWHFNSGLKVLFQSGYTGAAVLRHGVQHAEVAFLQKPFGIGLLARKVRESLEL